MGVQTSLGLGATGAAVGAIGGAISWGLLGLVLALVEQNVGTVEKPTPQRDTNVGDIVLTAAAIGAAISGAIGLISGLAAGADPALPGSYDPPKRNFFEHFN